MRVADGRTGIVRYKLKRFMEKIYLLHKTSNSPSVATFSRHPRGRNFGEAMGGRGMPGRIVWGPPGPIYKKIGQFLF